MTDDTEPRIEALLRYPVKGFSPEALQGVSLNAGETMPLDRAFAIENGPSGFDPQSPETLPKIKFLCLMRNPALAALATRFDAATNTLSLVPPDGQPISANLNAADGADALFAYLRNYLGDQIRGPLRLLRAPGHSFSDVALKCLHIVNLATVRAMEEDIGQTLDPMRFRPNIIIDGLPAWREFDLVGATLAASNGTEFEIVERTKRCAATRANPHTGVRDLDVPETLYQRYGHEDFGVYAVVTTAGTLSVGNRLTVVSANEQPAPLPF